MTKSLQHTGVLQNIMEKDYKRLQHSTMKVETIMVETLSNGYISFIVRLFESFASAP